jgi:hypothetical protein
LNVEASGWGIREACDCCGKATLAACRSEVVSSFAWLG